MFDVLTFSGVTRVPWWQSLWQWFASFRGSDARARGEGRPVSPQKNGYRGLGESQKERFTLLSAALSAAANSIVITDHAGTILWVNRAFTELTGYKEEDVVGTNPRILSSGKHERDYYRNLWDTILSGRVWRGELINRRKDGSLYTEEMTITPVLSPRGEVAHFIAIKQDVTERQRREQELREAEERYREIFEDSVLGMFQCTPDGRYLRVNRAMARMFGAESPEAYIAEIEDVRKQLYVDSDRRKEFEVQIRKDGSVRDFEFQAYRRDGTRVWLLENTRAVHLPNGEIAYYEGTLQDVSERKALEAQLRQAQKMEAVGRLAGGVAHDFNNMLGVISGYSEMLSEALSRDSSLLPKVQEIRKAVKRAASLTQQLMAFSRQQILQPRVLSINTIVAETSNMLRRLIGEDVELVFKPDPYLGNAKADPGQIVQIIMNLAVNARDAMPNGGQLIIETRNVELDEAYHASHPGARVGEYVLLTVSDTGCGMDAATLSHIFEPFFTTKELGRGTGLGLSIIYGIVKQSDGYVSAYSEPGIGSTFRVYLPRVYEKVQNFDLARAVRVLPKHAETILLVEDQIEVRRPVREYLHGCGYHILEAADGCEAVQIATTQPSIQVLITDVVMPGMNGIELSQTITELCPGVRVIYISGYSHSAITAHGMLTQDVVLVEKPFELRKLAEIVDGVLSQHSPLSPPTAAEPDGHPNDSAKKESAGSS